MECLFLLAQDVPNTKAGLLRWITDAKQIRSIAGLKRPVFLGENAVSACGFHSENPLFSEPFCGIGE